MGMSNGTAPMENKLEIIEKVKREISTWEYTLNRTEKTSSHKNCTPMFIAAVSTIPVSRNIPYIHHLVRGQTGYGRVTQWGEHDIAAIRKELLMYATGWMDLAGTVLKEIRHTRPGA